MTQKKTSQPADILLKRCRKLADALRNATREIDVENVHMQEDALVQEFMRLIAFKKITSSQLMEASKLFMSIALSYEKWFA